MVASARFVGQRDFCHAPLSLPPGRGSGTDVALPKAQHPDRAHRRPPDPRTHRTSLFIMPLIRSQTAPATRRNRPAGPHCRGGASSLLRLANPAAPRLPKSADLSDWISRAAASLLGGPGDQMPAFAASEFTR